MVGVDSDITMRYESTAERIISGIAIFGVLSALSLPRRSWKTELRKTAVLILLIFECLENGAPNTECIWAVCVRLSFMPEEFFVLLKRGSPFTSRILIIWAGYNIFRI